MMKRFLWVLVGLVILSGMLVSCTDEENPAITPTATRQVTPHPSATAIPTKIPVTPIATTIPYLQVDPENLKGVTVRFWHPFTDDTASLMRQLADEFNEENEYGIRVEVFSIGASGSLDERFSTAMLQEDGAPMLVAGPQILLHHWNEQGWLIPVQDYIKYPAWNWDADEVDAFILAQHQDGNGNQISLPLNWYANVLFYNQTWAQELNQNRTPTDMGTFEMQACAAKDALLNYDDRDNDGTGGYIINRDADALLGWLNIYGYDISTDPDEAYQFSTDEAEEAFTALWELSDAGCAWQSRVLNPYDYFAERKAIFYAGSTRDIFWQERAMQNTGNSDEWTVIPYPSANGAAPLLVDSTGAAIVAAAPEEQLASWLFLQTLTNSRNQALIAIAASSMPVRESAWEWLEIYAAAHPQWALVHEWENERISVPTRSDWLQASNVLEDAAWELYQPFTTQERIPTLLEQLDAMIAEITD